MYIKLPSDCTSQEISDFIELVAAGSQVDVHGLSHRVKDCRLLAFHYEENVLVAVSAVKRKSDEAVRAIHSKAKIMDSLIPALELGYCVTQKDFRGRGFNRTLNDMLLAALEGNLVYAVTGNDVMKRYLTSRGFRHNGESFPGRYNDLLTYFERDLKVENVSIDAKKDPNYYSVNDLLWVRFSENYIAFGSRILSKDVHLTLSFHSSSSAINFHLTKNTTEASNKPKVEIVRIDKGLFAETDNQIENSLIAILFNLLEPIQVDVNTAEYVPLDIIENNSKHIFPKFFDDNDYVRTKSRLKITIDWQSKLEQIVHESEFKEIFQLHRRPLLNAATLNVEGGIILDGSVSILAIKWFDRWYAFKDITDPTVCLRGLIDESDIQKLKRRFRAALICVQRANNFQDTATENAKVLHLVKRIPK